VKTLTRHSVRRSLVWDSVVDEGSADEIDATASLNDVSHAGVYKEISTQRVGYRSHREVSQSSFLGAQHTLVSQTRDSWILQPL